MDHGSVPWRSPSALWVYYYDISTREVQLALPLGRLMKMGLFSGGHLTPHPDSGF